jgi:hypothetical protein
LAYSATGMGAAPHRPMEQHGSGRHQPRTQPADAPMVAWGRGGGTHPRCGCAAPASPAARGQAGGGPAPSEAAVPVVGPARLTATLCRPHEATRFRAAQERRAGVHQQEGRSPAINRLMVRIFARATRPYGGAGIREAIPTGCVPALPGAICVPRCQADVVRAGRGPCSANLRITGRGCVSGRDGQRVQAARRDTSSVLPQRLPSRPTAMIVDLRASSALLGVSPGSAVTGPGRARRKVQPGGGVARGRCVRQRNSAAASREATKPTAGLAQCQATAASSAAIRQGLH